MTPPRFPPFLFAALAAPVLAACAAAPAADGVYPLRPRESVTLAGGATLTYDGFSDSRCPPGVTCIWAGRLVFHFFIDSPGGREAFSLGPEQPAATPAALEGTQVTFDTDALPPARAPDRAGDALPVTLRISRAGASRVSQSSHPSSP